MMNLIIKGRGNGKTSDLIRMSARTGIPIVCSSPEMVILKAKEMGFDICKPISFRDFKNDENWLKHEYEKVYVDELDWFFQYMFGMELSCATINVPSEIK